MDLFLVLALLSMAACYVGIYICVVVVVALRSALSTHMRMKYAYAHKYAIYDLGEFILSFKLLDARTRLRLT